MSSLSTEEQAAIRYLLGRMTDEESRSLEQRILQDREAFDEVMAAEDDLIDSYLEGSLTHEERQHFERAYLKAPDRRARVEFARALREKLGRERPADSPSPRVESDRRSPRWRTVSLAAAAALFAAIGAYLAVDASRLRREVDRLRSERTAANTHDAETSRRISDLRSRGEKLERDLQGQRDAASRLGDELAELRAQGGRAVTFLLTSTLVRGGGQLQTLKVPADAASVRLAMPLPLAPGSSVSSFASYRAVIQTPEGKGYWAGTGSWPAAGAKSVTVVIPAPSLPPGDYILSLTGVMADGRREPAADFSFRVAKG